MIAGLAGGFISATATTASMGRLSRSPGRLRATVAGAHLASVVTFAQLAGIVAVADSALLVHLWPALVAGGGTLAVIAAASSARHEPEVAGDVTVGPRPPVDRPFGLRPAILLASVLTLALLVGRWVVDVIGPKATMLASGAAGLADAHAGALAAATLHQQGQVGQSSALLGVGAALSTNTVVKCVLAFTAGGRHFGWRFCAGVVPAFGVFLGVVAHAAAAA